MDSRYRTLNSLDPTKIFERLCVDVLRGFWGEQSDYSDCFLFGTARTNGKRSFKSDVRDLCAAIFEGDGFQKGAKCPKGGDGGLDVVIWKSFADRRFGSLVGFAQCKTGDNWEDYLGKTPPKAFCQRFFQKRPLLDPVGFFLVPCQVTDAQMKKAISISSSVFFDRSRVTHFAFEVTSSVITDCHEWLKLAIDRENSMS